MCVAPFPHRLVKAVLGVSSVAAEKLEEGPSMVILGVESTVSDSGLHCIPDKQKRKKWIARIKKALASKKLTAGEASKLSGALQWATQNQFRRLGRAMLRPIYRHSRCSPGATYACFCSFGARQIRTRSGQIDRELELALRWWLQVLELEIAEERSFVEGRQPCVHLFSDARSTPPRVAAVLFM